jgi:hypothetical protein
MRELMERILETKNAHLIDEVLAGVHMEMDNGSIVEYVGAGMGKIVDGNGVVDIQINKVLTFHAGPIVDGPIPVLSTPEQPDGVPLEKTDDDTQNPTHAETPKPSDNTTVATDSDKSSKGVAGTPPLQAATGKGSGAPAKGGKSLFNV